jgi:P27 family predicted phage terminase small subunit
MKGAKPTVKVDKAALMDVPRAPSWLSKEAKAEWRRIMPLLVERKILTEADMGSVESYCVATGRVRQIEALMSASGTVEPPLFRMQDKAMQTQRQLAAELGLTPVSRSRPAMREDADDADALLD